MPTRPWNGGVQRAKPSTAIVRRPPWSLLQMQWLDIPIGDRPGHDDLTWGAFSESFDRCLRAVSLHVCRCVKDEADLQGIVSETLEENLDVLVSPIGESEKLRRLLSAAELSIARRMPSGPRRTDERGLEDPDAMASGRASDT